MNEHQARQEGLEFTGIYNFNKEETKAKIAKERKEKPKARIVLVRVPHSKLSRGYTPGSCGWAAYADKYYRAYNHLEDTQKRLENYPNALHDMLSRHEGERKSLEDNHQELLRKSKEAKEILEN